MLEEELPQTTQQSIGILREMLKRTMNGEVDELAVVAIAPTGEVLTAYSECQSNVRMGGALVYAGMRRMGFKDPSAP